MAEPTAAAPAAEEKKTRKRNTDGKRGLTFVYTSENGEVVLAVHRTKAFSVTEAWKEYSAKHSVNGGSKLAFALPGQQEAMANKIRKPTRTELLALAGLED